MRSIYIITVILAACSILYELLIAHTLSLLAANTVIWYSLTIGIYLGAMGIGALFLNKILKEKDPWKKLLHVEISLVIFGALAVPVIKSAQMFHTFFLLREWFVLAATVFPFLSFIMIVIIGLLTGLELPLLITIASRISKKNVANRVLGYDYMGSLLGALALPLLLLPHLENIIIGFLIALLNLSVAIYILSRTFKTQTATFKEVGTIGALCAMFFIGIFYSSAIEQYFLKKYYFYHESSQNLSSLISPMSNLPNIERMHSAYQKIDIFQLPQKEYPQPLINSYSTKFETEPNYPRNYYLFLNGDYQVLSDVDDIYHEWFAHVPIILHGSIPKNILVLGGGDGLIDKELLKYNEVEKITHVDIDSVLIEAAKSHPILSVMNGGSLNDPRVEIIIEDAYYYVKNSTEKYDAIYIDFPFARDYTLSRLFSREFYFFVKNLLNTNGYAVVDSPDSEFYIQQTDSGEFAYLPGKSWEVYFHTLKAAGFETIFPYTSRLETDNKEALSIIESLMTKALGDKSLEKANTEEEFKLFSSKQLLENYVQGIAQGFIMLQKEKTDIVPLYKNMNIPLYVLNEKRFVLSVNLSYPKPSEIDWQKVNSIMRPIVLGSPAWGVRRPY